MSEYENEVMVEETEVTDDSSWTATRMFIELGATFAVLVMFVILILRLAQGNGAGVLGWTLVTFMILVLIGQIILLFVPRKQQAWSEATWQEATEEETAWEEADEDEGWEQPAEDLPGFITVGCPKCGTAFSITENDAEKGHFHCVHCGVKGFIESEDLDLETVMHMECQDCGHQFEALRDDAQCPACTNFE